jgi:chromatin remodeling complex protein RSC6
MGIEMAPRSEVVKLLWKYIKENNLQNPKDKRIVLFDDKLQKVFKKKSSHFMKLTKLLFNVSDALRLLITLLRFALLGIENSRSSPSSIG